MSSSREAKKIISRFQPDLCIGTGGYVSGPVIRQAQKMGIPTLIHEQNAFPGVTNKMLSKHADRVMLAIEDAKRHMDPNASFTVTGNPVRGQIVTSQKQASRDYLRLDNRPVILSFGRQPGGEKNQRGGSGSDRLELQGRPVPAYPRLWAVRKMVPRAFGEKGR